MRKHYRDQVLTLMKNEIIHVLLKDAHENGWDYNMRTSDIGKVLGTYRKDTPPPNDPFGRIHKTKLLNELEKEGRVEALRSPSGVKRIGWRLTEAEWSSLTSEKRET
ncbi:hypothetical protein F4X10_04250 [Candidatus Poribacteria bacterium]|nr:hypothetical protein [Candidatus Poribacteria bacterium]